jgi:hypothetical protein
MILRNQQVVDGNGKDVTEKAFTPSPEREMPAALKDVVFKSDDFDPVRDFEVEQLPPHKETKEEKKEEKAEEVKPVAEVKVEDKKEETKSDKETKEEIVEDKEDKKEDETKSKKEEEQDIVSKFLKPPKGEEKTNAKPDKKPNTSSTVSRDYSGFTAEETAALKQMSNSAFELASKAIKENKELAQLKGSTYLQHDQAYLLDPDFHTMYRQVDLAKKEMQYWQVQLEKMDKGERWTPITGWDKNGQPVLGQPLDPSKAHEEQVRLAMNQCYGALNKLNGDIQSYPQRYKTRVQGDLQRIEQERKSRFQWVANPKLLDHTIPIEGIGDVPLRKVRDDFRNLFPQYLQNHPAMEVCSDLFITLRLAQMELAELKNGKKVEQVKQDEKTLVEPSSSQRGNSNKKVVHGVAEFHDLPSDL